MEAGAAEPAVADRAGTAVYVYGVIRRRAPGEASDGVVGLGAEPTPVRAIEAGELAALVSDVPADWHAASRQDVAAHDRVLTALMDKGTVIPMRFGIVLPSDAAVSERLLRPHAAELAALADRIDGCEQMSLKAYYLDEALLRAVLTRRPELKRRADALEASSVLKTQAERIALGQEVAASVEEQRALDERALAELVEGFAEQIQVETGSSERHLVTIHLLVRRDRRPQLDAEVKRLSGRFAERLALRYVGPLPPYSFCTFALDAEPRWG